MAARIHNVPQPRCPEHRRFLRKVHGGRYWACPRCSYRVPNKAAWKMVSRVPEMMADLGLTRAAFAREVGISYRETCRIVGGKVSMLRLETIRSMAVVLRCPPGFWWTWEEDQVPPATPASEDAQAPGPPG